MKKIISVVLVTFSIVAFAQVTFGLRANLLYKADQPTLTNITTNANQIAANKGDNLGYNVGLSAKISTTSIFIMPEIYYTTFANKFNDATNNSTIIIKSNRVDLPVLVGINVVPSLLDIYAGPVASYNLKVDNQWQDFKENATKQFTVGYQIGAQAKISKLVLNARYEGAFNQDQRNFINTNLAQTVRYDSRPSVILVGLGFNF